MTGYQEAMTDPSYAGQIITFTTPHIGNTGANPEDVEATNPHALGCIVAAMPSEAASWRATRTFDDWLKAWGRIGLAGVDTRALTRRIRDAGAPNAVIAHSPTASSTSRRCWRRRARGRGWRAWTSRRTCRRRQSYGWDDGLWTLGQGYATHAANPDGPHVVAVDYGMKRNILRNLVAAGARVTVVPGDGDASTRSWRTSPPASSCRTAPATPPRPGVYAVPTIQAVLNAGVPLFGICLGHQLLGLAVGASTYKMHQGHRGANHPVKRLSDGRVEITSMNHGFAVDTATLPENARATHVSLFDGSLAGLELTDRPAFSVQYHPEASPGPQDSHYLFERFVGV